LKSFTSRESLRRRHPLANRWQSFLKDITWRFLGDPLAIPDIGNPLE